MSGGWRLHGERGRSQGRPSLSQPHPPGPLNDRATVRAAYDANLEGALIMAGIIRARTGDLPGALAALQEAMAQSHAHGNRLMLGITLEVAAVVLARLGEAEPSAVLSGAFSAHYPPGISPVPKDERLDIGEAQSLARRALGEAAYSAA
jgi:hypothetical protein